MFQGKLCLKAKQCKQKYRTNNNNDATLWLTVSTSMYTMIIYHEVHGVDGCVLKNGYQKEEK